MKRTEKLIAEVICDHTDFKKFQNCDAWVVQDCRWNIDNQRGEVLLRQFSVMDDL